MTANDRTAAILEALERLARVRAGMPEIDAVAVVRAIRNEEANR